MKKYLLSGAVLVVFALYAIRLRGGLSFEGDGEGRLPIVLNTPTSPANSFTTPSPSPVVSSGSTPPTSAPTTVVVATPKPTGKYKDGTYTGSVADAFYGNIQVKAVVSGGKIVDVIFLQYPNDRQTSIEINTQAMPILKQEAIAAQSAQVDGVSGATASSGAFIQSLQSALNQAV